MPVGRERRLAMARRRQQVAELRLKGWTQWAIAEELGVAQSTVSADLRAIEKEWRASAVRDWDLLRGIELQKLNQLECEALAGWERSQQPRECTKMIQDASGRRVEKRIEQQPGDPRFLEQVRRCIDSRRKLLGLDLPAPVVEPPDDDGPKPLSYQDLMRYAESLQLPTPPDTIEETIRQVEMGSLENEEQTNDPSSPPSAPEARPAS